MESQNKAIKVILAVTVLVTIGLFATYAVVRNKPIEKNMVLSQELQNIVNSAQTWDVAFTSWYGKSAPEFMVKDINGKSYKLGDYKGKNVLVVFWATWCPPCNMEIPHLKELRNAIGEDKLEILAISNEDPELVKNFAVDKKINYTVVSTAETILPPPFSGVNSIPTSFYIDKNGVIKLATEGLVSFEEAKAIIQSS